MTQSAGAPAVWVVKANGKEPVGTVQLVPVQLHGYRNDEALVSGAPEGAHVVTAGVQKMSPGLKVAVQGAALADVNDLANQTQQAAR